MRQFTLISLFILVTVGQALAWDNICNTAAHLVRSTTLQTDDFAEKRIVQRSFEGSGKIKDVKSGGLASKFTIIVDCGNDVLAEVPTSSQRASSSMQIGESISFSGLANGVYRRRYVNTHRTYIMISFNDNSSIW